MKLSPDKVSKSIEALSKLGEDFATFADVKGLLDAMLTHMKSVIDGFAAQLAQLSREIKASKYETIDQLQGDLSGLEKRIMRTIDAKEGTARSNADKAAKQLLAEVNKVKALIPDVPDQVDYQPQLDQLGRAVRDLTAKLTGDVNAIGSEHGYIMDAINQLKEAVEKADKRISKVAGAANVPTPIHWPRHESFTMNGSDTSVTLLQGVSAAGTAIIVRYQGQTLDLGSQYTVNGNKVNFTFTPINGTTISITYWP